MQRILVLFAITALFLTGCSTSKPIGKQQVELDNPVIKLVRFEPNPCQAEKAVGVTIETKVPARKARIIIEGAESFISEGLWLRKESPTRFTGSFIAPFPGVYPVDVEIALEDSTYTVRLAGITLMVGGAAASSRDPEQAVYDYISSLAVSSRTLKKMTILKADELVNEEGKIIYRFEVKENSLKTEYRDETKTYYAVLRKDPTTGDYIIIYFSEVMPEELADR